MDRRSTHGIPESNRATARAKRRCVGLENRYGLDNRDYSVDQPLVGRRAWRAVGHDGVRANASSAASQVLSG
jgi:hypothetical protein